MTTRERVLERVYELACIEAGQYSDSATEKALDALRAIIEAHECDDRVTDFETGAWYSRECERCPVAIAAHHLGIEEQT